MVQVLQCLRSTKQKPQIINCKLTEANSLPSNMIPYHKLHIRVEHIRKIYTDNNGRFPVLLRNVNQYIMIAYNCDSNAIIAAPFKSCSGKHRLLAYGAIMQCLKDRNMLVDLQILDNEASTEYK